MASYRVLSAKKKNTNGLEKQYAHNTKLSFCELSDTILAVYGNLIQNHRISSVQFSCSVVFDSLRPHELQHARPPCPSPTPGVHSDSHASTRWCHPAISSSVVPISLLPSIFPGIRSFPASGIFKWVSSLHQVAKVLESQPQHQSFQWTPRTGLL